MTQNLYCGLHEFSEMSFLLHVLRKEDLFIDVGANVGSYTILACAAIGGRGYSIEPVSSTYSRLLNNIYLNNINASRIKCINIGIGNKDGQIRFTAEENTINHVVRQGEQQDKTTLARVTTLDSILKTENPCVLKIDVEG